MACSECGHEQSIGILFRRTASLSFELQAQKDAHLHTPLVICGLALSTLAHISACAFVLEGTNYIATQDLARLWLGTIRAFGEILFLGRETVKEVKAIAKEVLLLQNATEAQTNNDIADTLNW